MVPEVEREDVVTLVPQMIQVGQVTPAVAQILVAEDQKAHPLRVAAAEVRARELQPVGRGECHRLAQILGVTRSGKNTGRSSKIRPITGPYVKTA